MIKILLIIGYIVLGIISFFIVHHHNEPNKPFIYRDLIFLFVCIVASPLVFVVSAVITFGEFVSSNINLDKEIFRRKE